MPSWIPREDVRCFGGALPAMVLYSPEPVVQLPRFRLVGNGRPAACPGYEITPGVTFCLIEGPGRFRLMVEGIGHRDEADGRFAWLGFVARAGGAVVAVVDKRFPTCDFTIMAGEGRARGGYVPVVRRDDRAASRTPQTFA
ncbi:hypothetical protein MF672_011595 [Actinomadura sp. ATCC 31491]|uniref:Uncharacterized protein n=1 Tax=Actinomadura luzonensis TaxID=2805427 RepID=A0ABT0FQ40_9ACTN|nr:hypothetical protein [Actinomadura luzonensis]MCK2214429.1 hypothetical protein [Actinomadura luzonensis]